MFRFFLNFTLFLLIIGALCAYPLYRHASPETLRALVYSFVFFYILTNAIYFFITFNGSNKDTSKKYLASIGIKLIISLAYFVILLREFHGFEQNFTVCFFSAYLLCTAFEVYFLFSNLRRISGGSNNGKN